MKGTKAKDWSHLEGKRKHIYESNSTEQQTFLGLKTTRLVSQKNYNAAYKQQNLANQ